MLKESMNVSHIKVAKIDVVHLMSSRCEPTLYSMEVANVALDSRNRDGAGSSKL